mgnify:FL=1|jgi:hypothetical protein
MSELETTLVSLHSSCQYSTTLVDYMETKIASRHKTLTQLETIIKAWGSKDGKVV